MLARLDAELSPAWAEVDPSGMFVRIMPAGSVDAPLVGRAREVMRDLGYSLEPPDPDEVLPEKWYRAGQINELSVEEADILASRLAAEFAAAQSLSFEARGTLESALRKALLRATVAARDESADLQALLQELDETAAEVLGPVLAEAFRAWMREKLASFS